MAAFVDSNVLIDAFGEASSWRDWSTAHLLEWAGRGPLLINDLVYAEVSVGFEQQTQFDAMLASLDLARAVPSATALFAAGKAFRSYRRRGGQHLAILPDFIIGAHADTLGIVLITRDPRRFRSYFPTLILVTPGVN